MFASIAHAAGAGGGAGAGAAGAGGTLSFLAPLVLMFAVFYFLLIRPQQKRAKEQKNMLDNLQKGDYVLTSGGLMGRIVEVESSNILVVDLGETKVRIPRGFVSGTYDPKALEKVADGPNTQK